MFFFIAVLSVGIFADVADKESDKASETALVRVARSPTIFGTGGGGSGFSLGSLDNHSFLSKLQGRSNGGSSYSGSSYQSQNYASAPQSYSSVPVSYSSQSYAAPSNGYLPPSPCGSPP